MHFSTRVGDAERNADDLIVDLLKESSDDGAVVVTFERGENGRLGAAAGPFPC